jgi:hypothetical protein
MIKKVAKAVKERTRKTSISLIQLQAVQMHTLLTEQLGHFFMHTAFASRTNRAL